MVADILDTLRDKLKEGADKLKDVPDKLKDVPEKLKDVPEKFEDVPEKLQSTGQEVSRKLMEALEELRDEGEERAWELEKRALRAAGDLIERASEVPVASSVAPKVEGAVRDRLERLTRPPIQDYDELNVKKVRAALGELDRMDLLKVTRYEEANKNRKTVLRDIQAELDRRKRAAEIDE